MNRQIDYQKLLYKLQGLVDVLPGINPEEAFRGIKGMDTKPHDQLIRDCRDFQDRLQRLTEDCRDEVEKPIYIGIVGHYSHGKSSLLNALIFPPKTPAVLPIGEGVVTSLCTLVQFVPAASIHEFYEVEAGGLEKPLLPDEYQSRVSGKGKNLGGLSHFRVRLGVSLLDDQLFHDFAAKRIELLDTPGLGGPYWKDEHALMRWIKEFETIVVCIKATEINETTAITVNPFLKQSLKPCIPVVTFWDMWRDCADFKGISDEVKARAEAKKRISQFFGPLEQFADDTVFVSAKSCVEAREVPKDASRHFTDQWNVDNVRRGLASRVRPAGGVISRKTEESELDTQRRTKVRQFAEQLCSSATQYAANVRHRIDEYRPEGAHNDLLDEMKTDVGKDLEAQIDKLAGSIEKHFNDRISAIGPSDDWVGQRDQAKEQSLAEYGQHKQRAVKQLVTAVERFKTGRLDSLIKSTGLKRDAQGRLDRDFKRLLDDFARDATSMGLRGDAGLIVTPSAGAALVTNFMVAAKNVFWAVLRKYGFYGIIIGIVYSTVWWLLRWIPYLNTIATLGVGVAALSIIGIIVSQASQAMEKTKTDARNKTLAENTHSKLVQRVDVDLGEPVRELLERIARLLEDQLAPIDDQTREVLDSLKASLDKLEESTYEIKSLL